MSICFLNFSWGKVHGVGWYQGMIANDYGLIKNKGPLCYSTMTKTFRDRWWDFIVELPHYCILKKCPPIYFWLMNKIFYNLYKITVKLCMWKKDGKATTKLILNVLLLLLEIEKDLCSPSPSYSTFNNSIIIISFIIKRTSKTSRYGWLKDKVLSWDEPHFSCTWVSSKSKTDRISRDHTIYSGSAVEVKWHQGIMPSSFHLSFSKEIYGRHRTIRNLDYCLNSSSNSQPGSVLGHLSGKDAKKLNLIPYQCYST